MNTKQILVTPTGHQKAISICRVKLEGYVGLMRRITPLTLVALMLLQTLAMGMAAPASAAAGRGGANDDFRVVSISIGNASNAAEEWTQSNGTIVEYLFEGDSIEIGMEIQRGGLYLDLHFAEARRSGRDLIKPELVKPPWGRKLHCLHKHSYYSVNQSKMTTAPRQAVSEYRSNLSSLQRMGNSLIQQRSNVSLLSYHPIQPSTKTWPMAGACHSATILWRHRAEKKS